MPILLRLLLAPILGMLFCLFLPAIGIVLAAGVIVKALVLDRD